MTAQALVARLNELPGHSPGHFEGALAGLRKIGDVRLAYLTDRDDPALLLLEGAMALQTTALLGKLQQFSEGTHAGSTVYFYTQEALMTPVKSVSKREAMLLLTDSE